MNNSFKLISLSHKTAPVNLREKVALDDVQACRFLHKVSDVLDLDELLVLSTCNRTEVYYSSNLDLSTEIIKLLALEKDIKLVNELLGHFVVMNDDSKAREHLFRVSIGLESQVIGDIQITNQIKKSYQQSADANLAGPLLHRLLHTIFFTNKRVVQETSFKDGAASISYATVDLVKKKTSHLENPRILKVGLGDIGTDVVDNLKKLC